MLLVVGCAAQPHDDPAASPPAAAPGIDVPDEPATSQPPRPSPSPAPPPQTATPDPVDPTSPPEHEADAGHTGPHLIAEAQQPAIDVYADPDGDGDPIHRFAHPREVGAPLTFLVEREQGDWLRVLLPVRPNGATGWIQRETVRLMTTSYRVEVSLSERRLTVHDGPRTILDAQIGVGGDGTPTPPGRYYVTELLQPPDPNGPYGPFAFGLSGFSEVHVDFAGGEGVIGIHGTNDPDSIGRDVSNGCIRLPNDVIVELAGYLPLGAPVTITA